MTSYPESTDFLQASLYLDDQLLATGEAKRYSPTGSLSFFPTIPRILDTAYPEAMLRVEGTGREPIRVKNLRQCSESGTHWDFDLVV